MSKEREKYWLSLEDYRGDKAFQESLKKEFLSSSPSLENLSASRREFLQIMGAGLALTSSGCMRRPAEKLVPYVNRPADIIPGEANYYASSYYDGEEGFSTLIKTREGRPIKIEGNEEAEALNGSALSPRAHAYLLSLYDPERLKGPKQNLFNEKKTNKETINISFEELDARLVQEFQKGGTALLTNRIPSPSFQRLAKTFQSVFAAKRYLWDPISREDAVEARKLSYGQNFLPSYNLSKAGFLLSLNCDFLGTYLSPTEFQKQFARGRRPNQGMSKLVVLESLMSLTGSNADERHRLQAKDQIPALTALCSALIQKEAFFVPQKLKTFIKSYEESWAALPIPKEKWLEWAEELIRHKGRGLILFGGLSAQTEDSQAGHILVNFLNSALGNEGQTINSSQAYAYEFGSYAQMQKLISSLKAGEVKRLIIHGVNPLYSYPDSQELLSALKKAELVVYTGDRVDETGFYADFLVPDAHPLEKWSDWEFKKGVFSIQQPAIRPLYNTRSFEDSLISWIQKAGSKPVMEKSFYAYIKTHWQNQRGSAFWNFFLKRGLAGDKNLSLSTAPPFRRKALTHLYRSGLEASAARPSLESGNPERQPQSSNGIGVAEYKDKRPVSAGSDNPQNLNGIGVAEYKDKRPVSVGSDNPQSSNGIGIAEYKDKRPVSAGSDNPQNLKKIGPAGYKAPKEGEYFLSLYETSHLKAGDLSNVAWLMEFPDPVTKICWDNYLCVSPATALKENLEEGRVVTVTANNKSLAVPVHIQPGQEDHTLALAVGYGRQKAGVVCNNKGVNAYPLAFREGKFVFSSSPALLKKTEKFIPLANVQGHHSMEGRDIVLETSLQAFKKDPSSGLPHHHKVPSLWPKHKYKGHKWGMVIDLNSCNGCGACMIACQSENNIPTVGKKYVLQGREMHWIRVDRYYKGEPSQPMAVHQPVVCMHCDNAPCETVCPVLATVHSDEGTNDMIYNRCVGTRYCSNNCPYKVRRFNWFDYTKQSREEPLNLVLNPDVTVRHRGVMEKCSFCIQRIHEGKARAKKENRKLKDGDIQTACQQSCPAEAIVFGDLNDPKSKVSQAFQAENSYALLDDMLNTKPAVKYKTKVRNGKTLSGGKEKKGHH